MKTIYLCGPTVYSEVHIGNMRPIITFDIFNRSLSSLGEEVFFIHNITDIDDKIIDKAITENATEVEIATKYKKHYISLLKDFNIQTPSEMPEVTNNISDIVSFIKALVDKGAAYQVGNNVYFDVANAKGYGSLSNRELETMKFDDVGEKKHPGDFVLWKETEKGIAFDSPWGQGRPGWHTECSLFVNKFLKGESLDIHGGGIDLLFPHHENENIQYKALNDKEIAKEWRHVGHVMLDDQKMSKSLGNIFDAKAFAEEHGVDTLRFMILASSYSAPMNISDEMIQNAKATVNKWEKSFIKASLQNNQDSNSGVNKEIANSISEWNFSEAMKQIHALVKQYNENSTGNNSADIMEVMKLLGFSFANNKVSNEDKELVAQWEQLKNDGKYDEADVIRKELINKKLI